MHPRLLDSRKLDVYSLKYKYRTSPTTWEHAEALSPEWRLYYHLDCEWCHGDLTLGPEDDLYECPHKGPKKEVTAERFKDIGE